MTKTVLVADDSVVFRALEEAFLSARGYAVLHAADGAETVRLTLAENPDLILLDVQMPIMDGVQVLSAVKKNPKTKHIPIIIITTIGRDTDKKIFLKGGADDVISKPINGNELIQKVYKLSGGATD
jgi:two-component system, cell cycle response regulator